MWAGSAVISRLTWRTTFLIQTHLYGCWLILNGCWLKPTSVPWHLGFSLGWRATHDREEGGEEGDKQNWSQSSCHIGSDLPSPLLHYFVRSRTILGPAPHSRRQWGHSSVCLSPAPSEITRDRGCVLKDQMLTCVLQIVNAMTFSSTQATAVRLHKGDVDHINRIGSRLSIE